MSVWPFTHDGVIQDRTGAVLAEVGVGTWRSGSQPSTVGQTYTHRGVVSMKGRDALVGKQNRLLTVDGITYRVVNAVAHSNLGYVEVELRESKGDG